MPHHQYDETVFPSGAVIFFRLTSPDGALARSVLPAARAMVLGSSRGYEAHTDDYVAIDGAGRFIACFPREFVAAILPLETTGPGVPADANNPQSTARN